MVNVPKMHDFQILNCCNFTLGDNSHSWIEPNFPTICWFLTLQAHHVCLIPTIRNFTSLERERAEVRRVVRNTTRYLFHNY